MRAAAVTLSILSLLAAPAAAQDGRVDFAQQIRPILSRACFACHGPDDEHRSADLRLDERADTVADRDGYRVITPGDPDASELMDRIAEADPDSRMPPAKSGKKLSPDEIALLRRWISEGAVYTRHWSFVRPVRPPAPAVNQKTWPRSDLDRFVLRRLERAGLTPNAEADAYALIRRVTLDLIGVPPSPAEVRAYVADVRPDAYERLVDRLLASPKYGERWARVWLDLARYADSSGYGSDPLRVIWRYRDWVIQALNDNKPFDEFTIEQLAGDLLPEATVEQRLATAFHRNTMTNTEGGTDDEEFRVAAVKDRAETTAQVWMGLTLRCARCHNHKFDPIPQQDYYEFYALFNQTADRDRNDDAPRLETPSREDAERLAKLRADLAALEARMAAPSDDLAAAERAWEDGLGRRTPWRSLFFERREAKSGAELVALDDHTVVAGGAEADTDVYTLTTPGLDHPVRGLRLELFPHESHAGGGLSRPGGNGNIVLNDLALRLEPGDGTAPRARYVRIDLPGARRILSLAEVEVIAEDGTNLARDGIATQSSVDYDGPPRLAVDGNTDGRYQSKSVTHTRTEDDPWWELDLGEPRPVRSLRVWNRTDGSLHARLDGFIVTLLDADRTVVRGTVVPSAPKRDARIPVAGAAMRIPLRNATASFSQDGWSVERAIDADAGSRSGWALSPRLKERHAAVFETVFPVIPRDGDRLSLELVQSYGGRHVIGRLRASVSETAPARILPAEVRAALDVARSERTPAQRETVTRYHRSIAPALAPLRHEIEQAKTRLEGLKPVTTPVMVELPPDRRRKSHLHIKGNFLQKGEEVRPDVLSSLAPMPEGAPMNRLGVARWLLDGRNPLTARVTANRLWARLFGVGLVETEENFGSQGSPPSHPELLDWLAVELREGWDVKRLLKTIVMSATYRQSSVVTAEKLAKDARNRLLSRGPRFRLDAETLRDQGLSLAGILSDEMFGPSVYPPQPAGLWQAAFNGQRNWPTSRGEDRYRRGLYTFLRRTIPYPPQATFDMPSREVCAIRRIRTNTPTQAFVTLNEPGWMEATRALARRILTEGGASDGKRLAYALFLCLQRPGTEAEIDRLAALLASERRHFATRPDEATELAKGTPGMAPPGVAREDFAAWIVVANVLLNLDAVLMKG